MSLICVVLGPATMLSVDTDALPPNGSGFVDATAVERRALEYAFCLLAARLHESGLD